MPEWLGKQAHMVQIEVTDQQQVTVLEAGGRIDSSNASTLGQALNSAIERKRTQLVLDLAKVDYMSSAGLRELVGALKRLQGSGDLRLAQPSERVLEVLEIAGLDTIFKIYPTLSSAVQSY
jgi:anti-anti-sigma factor